MNTAQEIDQLKLEMEVLRRDVEKLSKRRFISTAQKPKRKKIKPQEDFSKIIKVKTHKL